MEASGSVFLQGSSLLQEALSPSSRQLLHTYFSDPAVGLAAHPLNAQFHDDEDDDDEEDDEYDGEDDDKKPRVRRRSSSGLDRPPKHRGGALGASASMSQSTRSNRSSSAAMFAETSKSFVQIQCDQRPFCLQLSRNDRGEIVVVGFTPDPNRAGARGVVERSGLIQAGDVLVAVHDEMEALKSVEAAAEVMLKAELPAILTFRRVAAVKSALGEYTVEQISRHLLLHGSTLATLHGVADAAAMIKAAIDVLGDTASATPLMMYVRRVEHFLCASSVDNMAKRRDDLAEWMDKVHRYVEQSKKETVKRWNATKSSNFKRIDVLSRQRDSISKKLDKMRATPELLTPDNHVVWKDFVELRHLASQLHESIEKSKQEHYLPDFDGYALRLGSDGIYIGMGNLWISSFHANFSVETRSTAPHVMFHLSTSSSSSATGLKLRIANFTLSTEGRLPSLHCDELNIEAQVIANVPFVFDSISGWSVPQDELQVKLTSFSYYERRATSIKRGVDHDTVIKLFINRLLPSVVRQAAQNLFCGELGPLIEARNAQLVVSGELKMDGRPLELYDAALNSKRTGASAASSMSAEEPVLRKEARRLVALTESDSDALCRVFKSVETSFKKRGHVTSEHSNLSLRVLSNYWEQMAAFPEIKVLLIELWHQALQLAARASPSSSPSPSPSASPSPSPSTTGSLVEDDRDEGPPRFATIVQQLEHLQQYPVDISVSLSEFTFRLDLCEAAAVYYTTLQRIIRHKMDSVAVGLANLDAMKDGSYFEKELASLDEWYDKTNRVLSYVTINVDDLGVVLRGGIPAGFTSNMFLDARDLTCKGPVSGTFTVPLTDMPAMLMKMALQPRSHDSSDTFTAFLNERKALVLAKYFMDVSNQDDNDGDNHVRNRTEQQTPPSDRVAVSVKNTSARVLFEVPSNLSLLTPGSTLVPFAISIVTSNEGSNVDETPELKIETGEYAKCQYKAEQITVGGSMWRLLQRARDATDDAVNSMAATIPHSSPLNSSTTQDGSDSVWTEYLDSPSFALKFRVFATCQVTREHIFWSIRSAALSEPKVLQFRHCLSVVELLQDIGMSSLVESGNAAAKQRRHQARLRRAAHRRERGFVAIDSISSRMPSTALGLDSRSQDGDTLSAKDSFFSCTDDGHEDLDDSGGVNNNEAEHEDSTIHPSPGKPPGRSTVSKETNDSGAGDLMPPTSAKSTSFFF